MPKKTATKASADLKYSVYVIQILIIIVLSYLGIVMGGQMAGGVSLFYWAYPFFVLFTLYWGIWGIAGAYLGSVIGAGMFTGLSPTVSILFSTGDLIAALLIYIVYNSRMLRDRGVSRYGDDIYGNRIAAAWFFAWVIVVTNIIGGLIGVTALLELNVIGTGQYFTAFGAWVVGDALLLLIFPALSGWLTPIIRRNGLIPEAA
jgi:hypothetical protein